MRTDPPTEARIRWTRTPSGQRASSQRSTLSAAADSVASEPPVSAAVSRRALPQILVVDLRHGGAEPAVELRLDRGQLLALALEAAGVGEVQIDHEHGDEAARRTSTTALGELALDLAGGVGLEHVAFLDVGEVP